MIIDIAEKSCFRHLPIITAWKYYRYHDKTSLGTEIAGPAIILYVLFFTLHLVYRPL